MAEATQITMPISGPISGPINGPISGPISRPIKVAITAPNLDVPMLDVVVPVFNEEAVLAASVERLHAHLRDHMPFSWRVTIADNASTDTTLEVARLLAAVLPGVEMLHLDEKGRGRALRAAWGASDARIVAYMDVDLSTDLAALLPLIAPLVSGHSDVSIGSRLARGSRTVRGPKREVVSRTYNRMLKIVFRNGFRDAQCGFKALRADVARRLLPEIEDEGWFFDTELLLLAEHNGLRINEVPVDWVDDPDSRVRIISTAWGDLQGTVRMARRFWTGRGGIDLGGASRPPAPVGTGGELVTFVIVGVISSFAALGIFLILRDLVGSLWANAVALAVTGLANTAANRRWTFGRTGTSGRPSEWARASTVHAVGLLLTTGSLLIARAIDGGALGTELVLLGLASGLATGLRFLLMPAWVFRRRTSRS
jgi:putative flippase GtrA